MTYKPEPIVTSGIGLPVEVLELKEELAKNIHEVWASQRIEQGWTYGPERNDRKKMHPNLVPYEELTEEDKDYDRNTAMETLKMILSLGFKIEKDIRKE
ncbi:RyR domain-containing protein [Neobacillus vireti]|uniref:RyR domain-containing protein n=1 Tax=Neobacillus vireti TaxID=220686 RepID=UPI0030006EFB